MSAHKGAIGAMAFSSDGKYVATGGQDKILYVWTVNSTGVASVSGLLDLIWICPQMTAKATASV